MHFRLDNLIINYLKDKTLWKLLHVSKSSCRCTLTSTPTATSGRARTAASTFGDSQSYEDAAKKQKKNPFFLF